PHAGPRRPHPHARHRLHSLSRHHLGPRRPPRPHAPSRIPGPVRPASVIAQFAIKAGPPTLATSLSLGWDSTKTPEMNRTRNVFGAYIEKAKAHAARIRHPE